MSLDAATTETNIPNVGAQQSYKPKWCLAGLHKVCQRPNYS
uniref:Uncharacterized protein n=1 Tax=Arundo donax TaxID=35708 RepID=A0A0A9G499_ARUDO